MPSHRRRIHRSRRSKKPFLIVGFIVAIVAVTIIIAYIMSPSEYTLTIYTVGQGNVVPTNGTYAPGDTVNLEAVSAQDWTFHSWNGDAAGSDNTSITMNGNKIVKAVFANNNTVKFTTSMGDIVIQLRDDMPITTGNFRNLVEEGVYDNTIFHRVVQDFMIQGGDPTGTGMGDPDIPSIQDEFIQGDNLNLRATIAMANRGPNTGSSQFFINLKYNIDLDTKHPVFGRVVDGMDVVDAISLVEVVANPLTGENSQPAQDVELIKAEVLG